jgi:hypothetical protein
MSSLDPDWPGNWEDDEDPKTEPILGSMGEMELLKLIKSDPKKEVYRQYPLSISMYLMFAALVGFMAFMTRQMTHAPVSFLDIIAIILVGLCYYDTRRYATAMNSLGVGGKEPYNEPTAIEWNHVEHVEIRKEKERITWFIFHGNNRVLWHDNPKWFRKISLEVISRYIDDFDRWRPRQKIGCSKGATVYSSPLHDISLEDDSVIRKEVDEFDPYHGHYATKEIHDSLGPEQLFRELEEDPKYEKFTRYASLDIFIGWVSWGSALCLLMLLIAFLSSSWDVVGVSLILLAILWISAGICRLDDRARNGFIISSIGVGLRAEVSYTAIRWEHLEWIDVFGMDDAFHAIKFTGNRRTLALRNNRWSRKFTLLDLEKYFPEYKSWRKQRLNNRKHEVTRYRRPS